MCAFVDGGGRHDGQVDGATQIHKILLSHIRDDGGAATAATAPIRNVVTILLIIIVVVGLSQNLSAQLFELLLVVFIRRIVGKVIQLLAQIKLLVQGELPTDARRGEGIAVARRQAMALGVRAPRA